MVYRHMVYNVQQNTTAIPSPIKTERDTVTIQKNWLGGKLSSSFVSEINSISMFPFT